MSALGQAMTAKPKNIDEYLARLSVEKRDALEKLRSDIRSAAPKAEEILSYGVPAYRLGGRLLMAFGAATNHCAFYPGAFPVETHKDELKAYGTSKGTIHFQADSPLPAALVRKLVKTRIAEYAAQQRHTRKEKPTGGTTSRLKRPVYPMPDFIRKALRSKGLVDAYDGRPPYQRNDYIGWITRAKLPATQQKRLAQMLDELAHGDAYMKMAHRPKVGK
jgi:uncharacterized protein YdhG (YjbR/CyaY superfamily)